MCFRIGLKKRVDLEMFESKSVSIVKIKEP